MPKFSNAVATVGLTLTVSDPAVIDDAIVSGEGQTCWMKSEGVNEDGIVVSVFEFEWTLKLKP